MAGQELEPVEPPPLTVKQRAAFLAYVADHKDCSVREACEAVGVKRASIRALKRAEPDFNDDYREARGYGNEQIRNALRERAIEGLDVPIVSVKGEIVGYRREYSDRLLDLLARMHLPEAQALQRARFGLEVTGAEGGPIKVQQQGVTLVAVAEVLRAAGALPDDSAGDARHALPAAPEVLAEPEQL